VNLRRHCHFSAYISERGKLLTNENEIFKQGPLHIFKSWLALVPKRLTLRWFCIADERSVLLVPTILSNCLLTAVELFRLWNRTANFQVNLDDIATWARIFPNEARYWQTKIRFWNKSPYISPKTVASDVTAVFVNMVFGDKDNITTKNLY